MGFDGESSRDARTLNASDVVNRFGGHPIAELGIDLGAPDGPVRWLVATCLYGGRIHDAVAGNATRRLQATGLTDPTRIVGAAPATLAATLAGASYPKPERAAQLIWRAARSLIERYDGSIDALVSGCDDLESLAARLADLAPGFGAAAVARFLRPLRDHWVLAREVPLLAAARAAALHLGLLEEGEDTEGEPGALRAALQRDPAPPTLADAEFALARLGAAACLRERIARCPLADACPARFDR